MIFAQYYYINDYSIFIKFQNDKIVINMIDMEQTIYENIILSFNNSQDILIINNNEISKSIINLYDFIVTLFDEVHDTYIIETVNKNKYIHLTFRESINNNIKCMIWIKIKKYKNISDDTYLQIVNAEIKEIEESVRLEEAPKFQQFIIYIQHKLSLLN